jgi:NAD(P)-dependent dehydrogenase (short-subunit alcohol dehydrogenase family)
MAQGRALSTVLVTGASRGLGLELARQYAQDGWEVLACARAPQKAPDLERLARECEGRVTVHALDVTDFAAVGALALELDGRSIDVLINNAGSMGARGSGFGSSDYAAWNDIFHLNAFAPMRMAEAFAAHVARSAHKKLVSISTIMASMTKNDVGGFYPYRASKAALNAIMVSLAVDLGRRYGIVAAVLHPGWVRTDMGGPRADIDAASSVAGMRRVIGGLSREQAGRFWSYDGTELPW